MKKDYPIEITAFDCVPIMIDKEKWEFYDKAHCENIADILEKTLDGRIYENCYQILLLAKRPELRWFVNHNFQPADIGCCEEILQQHKKLVRKYGLYGEKK